jgi:sodium-dependent phosphate transporter
MDMGVMAETDLGDRKGSSSSLEECMDQDKSKISFLFQSLQILTAYFGSFVQGTKMSAMFWSLVALCLFYDMGSISSKVVVPVVYTLWWYCSLYWSVGLGKELSRPWENI